MSFIQRAIERFREVGRDRSKTFAFWDDFLLGEDILLCLLPPKRDSNFDLHLNTVCEVIPWMHVAGRHTYAKFLPMYIADMRALEQKQTDSYQHLQSGGLVVWRTDNHRFNCVATDQALEQTVNRDGKSKGLVVGPTLHKSALSRVHNTSLLNIGSIKVTNSF